MSIRNLQKLIIGLGLGLGLGLSFMAFSSETQLPESFNGEDSGSLYAINYDDIDMLLRASVLNTGRSTREKAKKSVATVGTRLKERVNVLTANEGNRFYFEGFKTEEQKALVRNIRDSLASVATEIPLNQLTKNDQIAYWLNLYNLTVLDQLIQRYPKGDLEDLYDEDNSILDKKLLNVSGVALSLNDIQHDILDKKLGNDPIVIYGLYQGYVGGPNIRSKAYYGYNVMSALKANADEFVNSNRGTYPDRKNVFNISSLYERNKVYFPDFNSDVKKHILKYLQGGFRYKLEDAKKLSADIDDWDITDVFGTQRTFGAGLNTNGAAMLDSVAVTAGGAGDGDANTSPASLGMAAEIFAERSVQFGRFTPEQLDNMKKIRDLSLLNGSNVTITDMKQQDDNKEEKKSEQ